MKISSTDVQNNFGKYLALALDGEDVIVTRNGKEAVKLIPYRDESMVFESTSPYDLKNRVSYEDFIALTESSDLRYELIDGEVFILASPSYRHQTAISEIFVSLYNWFKGKPCQPLTAPFDVTLVKQTDNINVVQPDILVICDKENIDVKGKYKGVPTLVVEVLSHSTRSKDMLKKLDLYMQTGIKEYWLVDPAKKEIFVYTFKDQDILDYTVYTDNKTVRSDVFEGFEIELGSIFEV